MHSYLNLKTLLISLLLLLGVACSKQDESAKEATETTTASAETADYVFTGGKVYTVNDKQPWAEAVAVKGNKIVYVGDAAGAKNFVGKDTKTIDTAGKTVFPGFISTHDHLIASDWTTAGVQLFDLKTKEEVLKRIKEYAEANPDHKVIKAVGHWQPNWTRQSVTARRLFSTSPCMMPGSTARPWKLPRSPKTHPIP